MSAQDMPAPMSTVGASSWLERASDLLAEPDPGPTPYLLEPLIVDQAITAIVGRWKTTKTYALLDMAISIVTGQPFLGRFQVPNPGPVVLVLEESGRNALWRRLDSLCRGRAIDRDALADLRYAANQRVRLDDSEWQRDLLDAGKEIQPRAFIFDPLARLKAAGRDESAQKEYAVLIDFMRYLRDETGAAPVFVQHTGHQGDHMRGTSDLESVWESRLSFTRDDSTITIASAHREAENAEEVTYRLSWEDITRTIRLEPIDDPLQARVDRYLADHPDASGNDVFKELGGKRKEVLEAVKRHREKVVPIGGYHLGTTPSNTPSASGTQHTPSPTERGAGTTSQGAGTQDEVPEAEQARLEALGEEMGLT